MARFDGTRVRARLLTGGFTQAYERFRTAKAARSPDAAFFALFESLNWAHAVDDLVAKTWSPAGRVEGYDWRSHRAIVGHEALPDIMSGMRYVRNRVHHQWADAFISDNGLMFPLVFSTSFTEWVWRDAGDLPAPPNEGREARGREAYTKALAGQPVETALAELNRAFVSIGLFLDPPMPTRRR